MVIWRLLCGSEPEDDVGTKRRERAPAVWRNELGGRLVHASEGAYPSQRLRETIPSPGLLDNKRFVLSTRYRSSRIRVRNTETTSKLSTSETLLLPIRAMNPHSNPMRSSRLAQGSLLRACVAVAMSFAVFERRAIPGIGFRTTKPCAKFLTSYCIYRR